MSESTYLYLGENLTVIDNKNNVGTYSTIVDASEAKIVAKDLKVNGDISFENAILHNLGAGKEQTDALNLKQAGDLVNVQTLRASGVEALIEDNVSFLSKEIEILKTSVDSEILRAKTVENNLDLAIKSEVLRAINIEESLSEKLKTLELGLSSEISRATSAETSLSSNLNAETNRATSAEASLLSSLNSESNRAMSAEASLLSSLNSESNRAMSAEASLLSSLNSESNRAKSVEASFDLRITTLEQRVDYLYNYFFKDKKEKEK